MNAQEKLVRSIFSDSIAIKSEALTLLLPKIIAAGAALSEAIEKGNKILSCGNGGSACDAEHFVGELVNRLEKDRPNLPAIALTSGIATLTAISNDFSFEEVFAKQVLALGKKGDILLAISTSGNSINILRAIAAAKKLGLKIIALTGRPGNKVSHLLSNEDIELCVTNKNDISSPRIQETHILLIHILCALIDNKLFNLY